MPLFSRRLGVWVDPSDVFVTLYSKDENAFWLDREVHPAAPFSIMGHAAPSGISDSQSMMANFDEALKDLASKYGDATDDLPFPWRPGFVGWFEYQQNPHSGDIPSGCWLRATAAIVFDHRDRCLWLVGDFAGEAAFIEWVNAALIRLGLSGGQRIGYLHRMSGGSAELLGLAHTPDEYTRLIEVAKEHIAAGDVYQICLTNRLELRHSSDPLAVFLTLRTQNPAPYANYIRIGGKSLVSVSPEQFLTVNRDGMVTTRPIKGTRARSSNPSVDSQAARELANHPKEQAENLMIVDLMRNDLARVSEADSVTVSELFTVEAHPTVHQLVSTVEAKLRSEVKLRDLITAVFPGGSMTGAPKIRAMELIELLEGVPRGVYSGAAGFLAEDGTLDLGMVIRSLVFDGDRVSLGVGGGITIDSDPVAEVAETELKALALLRVLGVDSPWV